MYSGKNDLKHENPEMLRFEVRVKYSQFCLIAIVYGTPSSSADFYSKIELQFKGEQNLQFTSNGTFVTHLKKIGPHVVYIYT